MKKLYLFLFVAILLGSMISLVNAEIETLGTFKQGECIELLQTCADCTYVNFSSINYPNSTAANIDVALDQFGSYFNTSFCTTDALGEYIANGIGDVSGTNTVFAYNFFITPTGNETPDSMPFLLGTIFLVIFGISFFFLYVSIQMNEPGPKLFFLILSFIFIFSTVAMAINVAQEANIASSIDSTLSNILLGLGMVLFVIIAYVMIRQTVAVLDMYKAKRGMSWGGVGSGYQYAGMKGPYAPY